MSDMLIGADSTGSTPLMVAAGSGRGEAFKLLIEAIWDAHGSPKVRKSIGGLPDEPLMSFTNFVCFLGWYCARCTNDSMPEKVFFQERYPPNIRSSEPATIWACVLQSCVREFDGC